jgi:hypothetical protein
MLYAYQSKVLALDMIIHYVKMRLQMKVWRYLNIRADFSFNFIPIGFF